MIKQGLTCIISLRFTKQFALYLISEEKISTIFPILFGLTVIVFFNEIPFFYLITTK